MEKKGGVEKCKFAEWLQKKKGKVKETEGVNAAEGTAHTLGKTVGVVMLSAIYGACCQAFVHAGATGGEPGCSGGKAKINEYSVGKLEKRFTGRMEQATAASGISRKQCSGEDPAE